MGTLQGGGDDSSQQAPAAHLADLNRIPNSAQSLLMQAFGDWI